MSFWEWIEAHPVTVGGIAVPVVLAAIGGAWMIYLHSSRRGKDESKQLAVIVNSLAMEAARREEELRIQYEQRLEESGRREQELKAQYEVVVRDLAVERDKPDAPPGIDQALTLLADRKTEAAEAVFQEVLARREGEGTAGHKEAAIAARHLGTLAFLHDTDKAIAAYQKAVELDPNEPAGWNQLAILLQRTGDLDGAADAFNRVLRLGHASEEKEWIAVATGNLGNVYQIRGDLDRAEEMFRKSLDLFRELGAAPKVEHIEGLLRDLRALK